MTDSVTIGEVQAYEQQCAAMAFEEAVFLADTVPPAPSGGDDPPDMDFIESCLANNERGDGILFARLLRDKFVYVKKRASKPWLKWDGHHWAVDIMGEYIRAVEKAALAYKDEAFRLDEPIRETS